MSLSVPVEMDRDGKIRRWDIIFKMCFKQQSIGAKIDELLSLCQTGDNLGISSWMRGSPPEIDTIGASHSSEAARHSSMLRCRFKISFE
jgi:hypothetical protein